MTLRTITFDPAEWQVVPKNPVPEMIESGANEVIAPLPTAGAKAGAVYTAMLAAAPEPKTCFCDARGIGDPAKSCGDCPQDYGIPTVRANPEPPAQEPMTDAEAFKRVMKLHGDTIRRLREGDSGEPT